MILLHLTANDLCSVVEEHFLIDNNAECFCSALVISYRIYHMDNLEQPWLTFKNLKVVPESNYVFEGCP